MGGQLRIAGVGLEEGEPPEKLALERFRVFAPRAGIRVHGAAGELVLEPPDNVYLRGQVEGRPGSSAVLTVREGGGMRGLIADGGRYWVLAGGAAAKGPEAGLAVRRIDVEREFGDESGRFRCSAGDLHEPVRLIEEVFWGAPGRAGPMTPAEGGPTYNARIAVETDVEFFNLFGNVGDATDYAVDLIAYNSVLYGQVDASLELEELSLWTGGADPWDESSPLCLLYEFGQYWNDNNSGVDRTLVHMMSGKQNGGGVAWLGVLCQGQFNVNASGAGCSTLGGVDNYGGDYAFSGDLDGNFDIDNPGVLWDIVVTAHELGHNFGSAHTHCYAGVGGNANQVDECSNAQCGQGACHCGGTSLPAGCPGSGQGCGTIMSYCHLLSGGLGNISLFFGAGQPYGTAPGRVNATIEAEMAATAAGDPDCLAPALEIFADGFESGDTSSWSSAVP